jgi:hypothetical protein
MREVKSLLSINAIAAVNQRLGRERAVSAAVCVAIASLGR